MANMEKKNDHWKALVQKTILWGFETILLNDKIYVLPPPNSFFFDNHQFLAYFHPTLMVLVSLIKKKFSSHFWLKLKNYFFFFCENLVKFFTNVSRQILYDGCLLIWHFIIFFKFWQFRGFGQFLCFFEMRFHLKSIINVV